MTDQELIETIYGAALHRNPTKAEISEGLTAQRKGSLRNVLERLFASKEFTTVNKVRAAWPAGHYYSPVVDPSQLDQKAICNSAVFPESIAAIELNFARMEDFWKRNVEVIAATPFPSATSTGFRYFGVNGVYPMGDAVILRAMLLEMRPHQFIEIGSGFSSACALDTADEGNLDTEFLFIEPYANRLHSLMRPQDQNRVQVMSHFVQDVPLETFSRLRAGDILLIDSTHVMKTGSDVSFELFKILPWLAAGVLIHFHDIRYPFEYPAKWIFDRNYSWNEIYALRAFLMYNHDYEIEFFSSYFRAHHRALTLVSPAFAYSPSSSLWIRKTGPPIRPEYH
jgi:hypothetical protein